MSVLTYNVLSCDGTVNTRFGATPEVTIFIDRPSFIRVNLDHKPSFMDSWLNGVKQPREAIPPFDVGANLAHGTKGPLPFIDGQNTLRVVTSTGIDSTVTFNVSLGHPPPPPLPDNAGCVLGWAVNNRNRPTIPGEEPYSIVELVKPINPGNLVRTWLWAQTVDPKAIEVCKRLAADGNTVMLTVQHGSQASPTSEPNAYDYYATLGDALAGLPVVVNLGNEFPTKNYYDQASAKVAAWAPYFMGGTRALRERGVAFTTPSVMPGQFPLLPAIIAAADWHNAATLHPVLAALAGKVSVDLHPYTDKLASMVHHFDTAADLTMAGTVFVCSELGFTEGTHPTDADLAGLVRLAQARTAFSALFVAVKKEQTDGYDFAAPIDGDGNRTEWFDRWDAAINGGGN